jgi:hypothetical protein
MQEKWRNAKSLWLSQWEFSENNSKWPMFSDTFFSHWNTDLEKKTYCNCLQGHLWNNNFLRELYNNGKVSKHLSLLCCMNDTRVGVLSLSLSVCACVSPCLWFLWTWPPWAISLHSSTKQTAKET